MFVENTVNRKINENKFGYVEYIVYIYYVMRLRVKPLSIVR